MKMFCGCHSNMEILQTCRFFDPQNLWEGMVCDPKINRDGRVLEEGPLDYQNYFIDTWTKSGHSIPVREKVAAHLHALNNRIANDPRVTATILPIGSGLTIATLKGGFS